MGSHEGLEQYNDLKQNHLDTYALREDEMNRAGYGLLRANKVKEAIEMFKLNVDAFPEIFQCV